MECRVVVSRSLNGNTAKRFSTYMKEKKTFRMEARKKLQVNVTRYEKKSPHSNQQERRTKRPSFYPNPSTSKRNILLTL